MKEEVTENTRLAAEGILRHVDKMRPYFLRITGNSVDAEDLCQSTILKLIQYTKSNPSHWEMIENKPGYIVRLAKNLCYDNHRKVPPYEISLDDEENLALWSRGPSDEGKWAEGIETHMYREELHQKLLRVMEDFTDAEKELIKLSYFEGVKPRHIAKILNLDPSYVQVDCNRVRAKFMARIKAIMKGTLETDF